MSSGKSFESPSRLGVLRQALYAVKSKLLTIVKHGDSKFQGAWLKGEDSSPERVLAHYCLVVIHHHC